MKVRLKATYAHAYHELTAGNVYRVLEVSHHSYRLLGDQGDPVLYDQRAFDVVDPTVPADWVEEWHDGARHAGPRAFEGYFFERFFDREPGTREVLDRYLRDLCWAERPAPDPATRHLELRWLAPSPDGLLWVAVELDEVGFEIRKVERYADGRRGHAFLRGDFGSTKLGSGPVAREALEPRPGVEVRSLTAAEFETIFDVAFDEWLSANG